MNEFQEWSNIQNHLIAIKPKSVRASQIYWLRIKKKFVRIIFFFFFFDTSCQNQGSKAAVTKKSLTIAKQYRKKNTIFLNWYFMIKCLPNQSSWTNLLCRQNLLWIVIFFKGFTKRRGLNFASLKVNQMEYHSDHYMVNKLIYILHKCN